MPANIAEADFSQEATEAFEQFGAYSNYRAIPDVRDGLKPGGRRILWAMNEANAVPGKKTIKAMSAIGDIMKYHPHGDSGTYTAMVTMAHVPSEGLPVKRYCPLIHGQGGWGDIDFGASAPRYTECRLNEYAMAILGSAPGVIEGPAEIRENGVDMVLNYSGDRYEPSVLPSMFPNFVINGVEGIGTGVATNAPSHNMDEALNLAIKMVDNPNPRWETISSILLGPDMPADADIFQDPKWEDGIKSYMTDGMGSFIMRARYTVTDYKIGRKTAHQIEVTGLPFRVSPNMCIAGIAELIAGSELPDDIEAANYTTAAGISLVIDIKENNVEETIQRLLFRGSISGFQQSIAVFCNAIVDGRVRTIGTIEALRVWIDHRRDVVRRRSRFRLERAEERLEIVDGFIKAVPLAEEIVRTVRASANRSEASDAMIKTWSFTYNQTQAILDMTIGQITKLGFDRYESEKINLLSLIDECHDLLNNPDSLDKRLKQEMRAIRDEYATPRRCALRLKETAEIDRPMKPVIESPAVKGLLVKSSGNWVRWSKTRGVNKIVGNGDHVTSIKTITNQNYMDAISSFGYQYRLLCDDLPEKMTKADSLFPLDPGENIVLVDAGATISGDNVSLVTLTKSGQIKRLDESTWTDVKVGKYKQVMQVDDKQDNPLAFAFFLPEDSDIGILTAYGRLLRLSKDTILAKGRTAHGLDSIRLENDKDSIIWAGSIRDDSKITYYTSDEQVGWFYCGDIQTSGRNSRGLTITKSSNLILGAVEGDGDIINYFSSTMGEVATLTLDGQSAGYALTDRQLKLQADGIKNARAVWVTDELNNEE